MDHGVVPLFILFGEQVPIWGIEIGFSVPLDASQLDLMFVGPRTQHIDAPMRVDPIDKIAEHEDFLTCSALDVFQCGLQRWRVAVDIREQGGFDGQASHS